MTSTKRIVVIGAGIGGLTTAALLARAGHDVTVLEAHVYPGGCAGTFFHKGYRFDAGATLAGGFYPGGPMDIVARRLGIHSWPSVESEPAMTVLLPSGQSVTRYGDERRWAERARAFGAGSAEFWRWQEETADALWDLALRTPPWPPQGVRETMRLAEKGFGWLGRRLTSKQPVRLLQDGFGSVGDHLRDSSDDLRTFVDGQLLIAAQTTSTYANALYGASALDLPRRGIVHLRGGIGAIAKTLAGAVQAHNGTVRYRQEVAEIVVRGGKPVAIRTKRGEHIDADIIVANLPPWNIAKLMGEYAPRALLKLPAQPKDGWGAFMLYAGVNRKSIPDGTPLHHQVIAREPMGEGNTVFLSISPEWDAGRAPEGERSITISTHTALKPWWTLFNNDRRAYERRKQAYMERMIHVAERTLPGLHAEMNFLMPGTPVTFQRFTRRELGWVGGFPQTSLFRAWAPKLGPNLWMVGDSIFPGQSTAAVALGGLRVAESILMGAHPLTDSVRHRGPQPEPFGGD